MAKNGSWIHTLPDTFVNLLGVFFRPSAEKLEYLFMYRLAILQLVKLPLEGLRMSLCDVCFEFTVGATLDACRAGRALSIALWDMLAGRVWMAGPKDGGKRGTDGYPGLAFTAGSARSRRGLSPLTAGCGCWAARSYGVNSSRSRAWVPGERCRIHLSGWVCGREKAPHRLTGKLSLVTAGERWERSCRWWCRRRRRRRRQWWCEA